MGLPLHVIAATLAAIRPDAATIIQDAAETYIIKSPIFAQLISST